MYIVYHYRTNYLHLTANPYLKCSLIKFQMTFQDSILQQKHCTWCDRQPASSIEKHLFHLTSKCSPGSFLKYFVYCQYNLLPSLIYQRQQARTHIKGNTSCGHSRLFINHAYKTQYRIFQTITCIIFGTLLNTLRCGGI